MGELRLHIAASPVSGHLAIPGLAVTAGIRGAPRAVLATIEHRGEPAEWVGSLALPALGHGTIVWPAVLPQARGRMSVVESLVQSVLSSKRLKRRVPTYQEFASTVKIYAGPAHIRGTPYRLGSDPCQAYLLKQFDAGRWRRFYICAPPQFGGKTLTAIIIPMLRNVIGARVPVGYGLPTLADLDKAWSEKLHPALKDSGYGSHLPASGPGARGGRGHTLQLIDPETGENEGLVVFLAGGGYGSTVAAALVDEIDQFRTAGGEPLWGALEDIFNRCNAFGAAALRVAAGTIEDDERSIILPLVFEQGTGTVPHPRCPHCHAWVRLSFDHISIDFADEDTAAASARIGCPSCATAWGEDDRQEALRDCRFPHHGQLIDAHGEISGPEPRTQALGLWWSALESPHSSLPDLAREWYRAKVALETRNDHELMRKFWRYRRCQVYVGDKGDDGAPMRLSCGYLAVRSRTSGYSINHGQEIHDDEGDSIHVAHKPDGVEFLTVTEDVQQGGQKAPGRNYFLVQGWASDRRSWDLAWGHMIACPLGRTPSEGELHACLDRVHAFTQRLSSDYGIPILKRGVDVGDRLAEIRRWLVRQPQWLAIRGVEANRKAKDGIDIQGVIYRQKQDGGWNLYDIDVHEMRQRAQNGFLVPVGKPGAAHLPEGLTTTSAIIMHYCATGLIPDNKSGLRWADRKEDRRHHSDWQKRRDFLDCRTYGCALAELAIRELHRKPTVRKFGNLGALS